MLKKTRDFGMLTTTEVAQRLYVHPNTVRQWTNKGLLHAYRLGPRRDRRFKREGVDSFIQDNGHGSEQSPYYSQPQKPS